MNSGTPSCFDCEHHEKIGRNKAECYCLNPINWLGKKDLIENIREGNCRSFTESKEQ